MPHAKYSNNRVLILLDFSSFFFHLFLVIRPFECFLCKRVLRPDVCLELIP